MNREQVAIALFVLSALLVIVVCTVTKGQADMDPIVHKWVGFSAVAFGMLLAGWAMSCAESASHGAVAPVLDRVVTKGPYRLVRHPMYLGFLVALVGVAIVAESYFGLASVFILFLPAIAFRGRLEERALSAKFGDSWNKYANQTSFIIPWVW